jgi:hypothetical protein
VLEAFFQRSFAIRRLRHGPLTGHIDLLADRLAAQGYSLVHSRIQLRHIGHFNRWLQQEHISLEMLDENIIERYWRHFMRERRVRPKDVFAVMRLLDLLREKRRRALASDRSGSNSAGDAARKLSVLSARGARACAGHNPHRPAVR